MKCVYLCTWKTRNFVFSSSTVDKLQTHWEDSQTKLSDRLKQILNMLQDSTNWLDAKREVDYLIKQASGRLESWQEITYTADALKKQHADLRVGTGDPSARLHECQTIGTPRSVGIDNKNEPFCFRSPAGLHEGPEAVAGTGGRNQRAGQQAADAVRQ